MTAVRYRRQAEAGFTLVELLTAVAILSLMVVFVGILLGAASKATQLSRVRIDADRQARLVFDSMANDFTRMLRRSDVDFHFVKGSVSATPGVNDSFFMFCENPGYFNSTLTSSAAQSNVSLIGYRINANSYSDSVSQNPHYPNSLEKLAEGLTWDVPATQTTPMATYPVVHLTFNQAATSFDPISSSTIIGQWKDQNGVALDNTANKDPNFHLLGDSTFRLAYCFLLTNGTYSLVPALNYTFTPTTGSAISSNLSATGPPASSNGYPTYGVGSRWYDNTNCRGYICTYAPQTSSSGAIWQPLGMADVQAVVVAVAILDQSSQKMVTANTALSSIAAVLANPTAADLASSPPKLMATTWLNTVNTSTFASSVGVPTAVASQVRIYQRFFYLNNLSNN